MHAQNLYVSLLITPYQIYASQYTLPEAYNIHHSCKVSLASLMFPTLRALELSNCYPTFPKHKIDILNPQTAIVKQVGKIDKIVF